MKRNLISVTFLLLTISTFGQGITEKSWDKFNVQTIEVLGQKFSVGDTLTFTRGANANGDFLCAQVNPLLMNTAGESPLRLTAQYSGFKYIIEKIRYIEQGLNSQSQLVFYLGKKTPVWVDANVAIVNKEIQLKEP